MKNLMTLLITISIAVLTTFSAQANNAKARVVYTSTGGDCTASCMKVEAAANTITITTFADDGSIVRLENYNTNEIRKVTNKGNGAGDLEPVNGGNNSGGISALSTTTENDDGTSSTTTFASFMINGRQYVYETVTIRDADGNVISQITTLYTRDIYVMIR